jgi:hypothetical protein
VRSRNATVLESECCYHGSNSKFVFVEANDDMMIIVFFFLAATLMMLPVIFFTWIFGKYFLQQFCNLEALPQELISFLRQQ